MGGISVVAVGLLEGKKYRRPYHSPKYVQIKQLPNSELTIVALVDTNDGFHKFVCPGDDIIATDWEEVV